MKYLSSVVKNVCGALVLFLLGFVLATRGFAAGALKAFTAEELAVFNGQNGQKAYYAYEGKVYDVTGSTLWKNGQHYGLTAGQDLTGKMDGAPHGTEVFAGFEVVGTFGTPPVAATATPAVVQKYVDEGRPAEIARAWYEQPIRIAGISILGWSGILLGVFFVLNFATCFALPWSQLPLPWKGSRPGPDSLDQAPTRMRWTVVHKYFAWATVVIGIVHGILGFMQMLGYRI